MADERLSLVVAGASALAATEAVASALASHGIPALVLKGPPVQRRFLSSDAAYRSADVDLLVGRRHGRRARRLLVAAGWRFSPENGILWRLDGAAAFVRGSVTLDLHWGLHAGVLAPRHLRPLEAALWEGAAPAPEGWYEPRPEALVVYLAVHAAARRFARPEILTLVDAAARVADPLEVELIARRIRTWPVVEDTLARAAGDGGLASPPSVPGRHLGRLAWSLRTAGVPSRAVRAARAVRSAHLGRVCAAAIEELTLFGHAYRLATRAQVVTRGAPLPAVVADLCALARLPTGVAPAAGALATGRACRRLARWGCGRDTCLVRSLVLGTLVADRPGVVLHVGFSRSSAPTGPSIDGHAWVTVDEKMVVVSSTDSVGEEGAEHLEIPIERPGAPGVRER